MSDNNIDSRSAGLTSIFVRRPVFALVVNTLIVVAGLAGLLGAEIRELPEVDRPVITITTEYPGAAPETVDRELTAVIEGGVGRVPGIKSISSSSRFGRSTVTVEFSDETNLNAAASDTRDAMGRIASTIPDEADDPRIVKADSNASPVLRMAITSNNLSTQDLTILVEDEVVDRLFAVPGVADLRVYGDREKIFRVDIDQMKLASLGLSVADLRAALSNLVFDAPAGSLTSRSQDIVVRTSSEIATPEAFESLVIRDEVRVRDVATVTLGPDPGDTTLRANGDTGVGIAVIRQAQSNSLEISRDVRRTVDGIQEILPDGVAIFVTSDDARFINSAISEVLRTLALAIAIVVAIIFLFLRDWRATLIPAVTMPVALIGTLAALYLVGFSVNILTLLALVLATGMVVDDAIVVLENIVRRRTQGMGPRAAAVVGTREVFFAVVTTTATLAAVFVPLSFLPGQTGGLFREFGFTLAFAVTLSSVVALSLCPMLASRLLKADEEESTGGGSPFVRLGDWLAVAYRHTLRACLAAPLVVVLVATLFAAAAFSFFGTIRQELTPSEDRAVVLISISAPQGVSLDFTTRQVRRIERLLLPLRETGEVTNVFSIAGIRGQANRGFAVLTLAEWHKRSRSQNAIITQVNSLLRQVHGVRSFIIRTNSLGIRGAGNGLQVALVGNNYQDLAEAAGKLVQKLEDEQRFGNVRLSYETTQPQLSVQIDRERASDLGININGLAEAMQAVLDGRSVGSVFINDRSFEVKMISTTDPVNDPTDLENVFLRTGDNRMVPMSTIATLTEKAVAPTLNREQQLRSISVTAGLTDSFALGDAYLRAVEIAEPLLPPGSRLIPLAEAATLDETSNGLLITFGFAVAVVLLVLAAQFESFVSAVIVMATVPLGLACAVFALLITGGSLNVYSQIGLVLLVGIMAKNGILIVEFANKLRDQGASVYDAIERASNIRLRPVAMTLVSTVLGGLPLVLSSGAGAEAREALGWIIVGGLGLAAITTLYLTPVAYLILARFSRPQQEEEALLNSELDAASGLTAKK